MKVLINKISNNVVGLNRPATPFEYDIDIDDSINITKEVETINEDRPKIQDRNENGELIYLKEIVNKVKIERILGYSNTTQQFDKYGNENEKVIVVVDKKDDEGNQLYHNTLYSNPSIETVTTTEITDEPVTHKEAVVINTNTGETKLIDVHNTNSSGEYLYYKDITTYDETIVEDTKEFDKLNNRNEKVTMKVVKTTQEGDIVYSQPEYAITYENKTHDEYGNPYVEEVLKDKVPVEFEDKQFEVKYIARERVTNKFDDSGNTNEKVIEIVNKTDFEGNILYNEMQYDESDVPTGEYLETINRYDALGNENERIVFEVHEKDDSGNMLYWENIEHIDIKNKQVPTEFEKYTPKMVDNIVTKEISLNEEPIQFDLNEVLLSKLDSVLNDEIDIDYVVADYFMDEEDININDDSHSANTGRGILELLPNGEARTVNIALEEGTTKFKLVEFDADEGIDIYINGTKFVDGVVDYASSKYDVYIKFVNTTSEYKSIRGYCVGY